MVCLDNDTHLATKNRHTIEIIYLLQWQKSRIGSLHHFNYEHNIQGETKVTIKSTLWIDGTGLSPRGSLIREQLDIFPS